MPLASWEGGHPNVYPILAGSPAVDVNVVFHPGLLLEQGRLLLASAEEDPDALKKWLASIEVAGLVGVFFFELGWLSSVGWLDWLSWVG